MMGERRRPIVLRSCFSLPHRAAWVRCLLPPRQCPRTVSFPLPPAPPRQGSLALLPGKFSSVSLFLSQTQTAFRHLPHSRSLEGRYHLTALSAKHPGRAALRAGLGWNLEAPALLSSTPSSSPQTDPLSSALQILTLHPTS